MKVSTKSKTPVIHPFQTSAFEEFFSAPFVDVYKRQGKGHAARAYAILYAKLCPACQKGAEEGPQGGFDRLFKGCAPAAERHTQARRKGRQKCRNGKAKIHKGKQTETDQSQKVPKSAIKRDIKPDMPA